MKNTCLLLAIFAFALTYGQKIEKGSLWRTKGVYDTSGNFIERAKIQSFLCASKSDQIYRLRTQDKLNNETGETKIFVYRDTLNLELIEEKSFKISEKEVLTVHSKDSITIQFNEYVFPYVKLSTKRNKVDVEKFKTALMEAPVTVSVEGVEEYQYTYQENGMSKIKPIKEDSGWESEYKVIDFNGFTILQGIVSAPKLITRMKKKKIEFLEIDYRFDNKEGAFSWIP
ncbi:hypothetical protein POV27_15840 [Aureisphaera galaxeae]|uniref:hypothetical protein n=1 Tax=Aureisphaera galaxeae TaxID=1538023 RepID=UPI0023507E3F|nr:hypothetical protein [Aureisphaera galaxeae]MDC8005530.1 hypothetical protein [Aureisphaera galaxeae]